MMMIHSDRVWFQLVHASHYSATPSSGTMSLVSESSFLSATNNRTKNCLAEPFAQHKPNENVRSRAPTTSVWVGLVAICWRDGSLAY